MEHRDGLPQFGDCLSYEGKRSPPEIIIAANSNLEQEGATLYSVQLALNLIWMPLFFVLKRPIEATVDITVLTGVTAYLTYVWSQVDSVAAWSIAPYLGWLSFATYLSVS